MPLLISSEVGFFLLVTSVWEPAVMVAGQLWKSDEWGLAFR